MADKEKVVGEISSFLSQSARQLETLLHKLKWSKGKLLKEMNSSKVVHCPLNSAHRVPESRLEKHSKVCQYNSIGMNPQDAPYSQEFFYQTCKAVIPVFIDNSTLGQELTMIKEVEDKLTEDKNKCSDSVAEIRSIMAWETIPASHRKLQFHLLSEQKIRDWIIGNLPQVQYLSSVEGASDRLVNFVLSCLQEKEVAHPDGMEEMLKDLLGSETQSFVVNLWKFLAVSIAEGKYESAVEHDVKKEISLTMDRVKSELPPQQRLAVYEHVVQVANAKREVQREEELEMDSKLDESKDEDNDQPKSRYELLAEQRDYKRRRQSYRAKNVHITKRSAVEVMRDLIETQMHVLEMQFKDERGASGNNSNEEDASSEGKESWGSKTEQMDYARRESRDDEGRRGTERDRRKHRDGSKRVRFYDDRETDSKRPRR